MIPRESCYSSGTKTASHQGFSVLVDEVLGGLGPFGQNNIIHPFLGDLQATQIKGWVTARTKDKGEGIREWI